MIDRKRARARAVYFRRTFPSMIYDARRDTLVEMYREVYGVPRAGPQLRVFARCVQRRYVVLADTSSIHADDDDDDEDEDDYRESPYGRIGDRSSG